MNIDNIFSPARTGWLMKKYVADNRQSIIMSGAFVTVVMVLIGIFTALMCHDEKNQGLAVDNEIGVMLVAFVFNGYLVASIAFKSLWNGKSAASLLMTPASAFEQVLVRWIVVVPVFIVWSLLSVMFADFVKFIIGNFLLGGEMGMIPWRLIFNFRSSEAMLGVYIMLTLFIFTQSFYLLGSVVWRKHAFVKTFFVMGLLFMLYAGGVLFVEANYTNTTIFYINVSQRDFFTYPLMNMLVWAGVIINYTLTVMRLKEAEIVHRW